MSLLWTLYSRLRVWASWEDPWGVMQTLEHMGEVLPGATCSQSEQVPALCFVMERCFPDKKQELMQG